MSLAERLDFVLIEMDDLCEYENLTWHEYHNDRKTRRNVERIIENVGNAVIDMAKIILTAADLPVPATYREALQSTAVVATISESDITCQHRQERASRANFAHV